MRAQRTIPSLAARRCTAALLAFVLLALAPGWAAAQSLDQLRAQGVVGERYDGYAAVRAPNASAQVRSFVANVNAQRRAIYEKRAAQQKVPVAQVGRIYAKQLFERAPPGTWFLGESGKWVRK